MDRKFVEMDKKLDNQVEILKGRILFPILITLVSLVIGSLVTYMLSPFFKYFAKFLE